MRYSSNGVASDCCHERHATRRLSRPRPPVDPLPQGGLDARLPAGAVSHEVPYDTRVQSQRLLFLGMLRNGPPVPHRRGIKPCPATAGADRSGAPSGLVRAGAAEHSFKVIGFPHAIDAGSVASR